VVIKDREEFTSFCAALLSYLWTFNAQYAFGFCFVSGTPATLEATEKLVNRIGFIRETHCKISLRVRFPVPFSLLTQGFLLRWKVLGLYRRPSTGRHRVHKHRIARPYRHHLLRTCCLIPHSVPLFLSCLSVYRHLDGPLRTPTLPLTRAHRRHWRGVSPRRRLLRRLDPPRSPPGRVPPPVHSPDIRPCRGRIGDPVPRCPPAAGTRLAGKLARGAMEQRRQERASRRAARGRSTSVRGYAYVGQTHHFPGLRVLGPAFSGNGRWYETSRVLCFPCHLRTSFRHPFFPLWVLTFTTDPLVQRLIITVYSTAALPSQESATCAVRTSEQTSFARDWLSLVSGLRLSPRLATPQ
jgi:hypothetical protein